jgi:hypothetical protein
VTRPSKVESNIKDDGEKHNAAEGNHVLWASASVMGGVTHADWITARSNMGEFSLGKTGERLGAGGKIRIDEVLWSGSGVGVAIVADFACALGWDLGLEFRQELGFELREVRWRVDRHLAQPKSLTCLGDGRTPLVSHWSQIHRSFLPCCQKLQEEVEMLETRSVGNNVHHSCRQMYEDGFQRITMIANIQRAERKDDEVNAYDLSTAQKVSSSTCPPRNIYHMRRVLAIISWRSLVAIPR